MLRIMTPSRRIFLIYWLGWSLVAVIWISVIGAGVLAWYAYDLPEVGAIEKLTRRELLSEIPLLFLAGWFLIIFIVTNRKRLILSGKTTTGVITESYFVRAFWQVNFEYEVHGEKQKGSHGIISFRKPAEVDDQVPVHFDPEDPEDCVIPHLFSKE